MTDLCLVYKLVDPRSPEVVRYIGISRQDDIRKRLNQHICHSEYNNRRVSCWIRSLKKSKIRPEICIIDKCSSSEWEEKEKHYISKFKTSKLTNIEPGGKSTTIRKYCVKGTNKNAKKVYQFSLDKKKIAEYTSCANAQRATGISQLQIAQSARRNGMISHGFRWSYKETVDEIFGVDKRFRLTN